MRKVLLVLLMICSLAVAKSVTYDNPMKNNRNLYDKGAGGPDAYGYRYIDSDTVAPGAPTFNWIDISGVGTLVTGLGDDNVSVSAFPIGFDFPYYWYRVNSFYVASNGYIAFGDNTLSASPFPNIPSTARPNNMVAIMLSDLDFGAGSPSCYYWTNAANDTCIITYQNLRWWNMPTSNCSLQIILAKPDSSITFQYKRIIGTPNGGWAGANSGNRTGIENLVGKVGLQYVNGVTPLQNDIHDNLAVKFIPPATTSYYFPDVSVWNAMNDVSGGYFAYLDSTKVLWANIKNSGTVTVTTCSVYCRVENASKSVVYSDAVEIASMTAGQTELVAFDPAWTPTENGLYRTIIKARISNDSFRGNDSVVIETHVVTYPIEMAYDDGENDSYINWTGTNGGAGMKFTPPRYPCIITGAKANLQLRVASPVGCTIYVYDDDGPGGSPGTVLAKRGVDVTTSYAKWYRVFLTDTIYDGSFFVGVIQNDSGCAYSTDEDAPISGQAWENTGVWAPYRDKNVADVMCRALVGFTPLEYDATALEIVTPISMISPGATVTPRALIGNYGTLDQPSIPVEMKIDSAGTNVYTGTATISLNAAQEDYVDFIPQWTAGPFGTGYDITLYTNLGTDQDQTNDTIKGVTSAFFDSMKIRARFAAVTPTIDGRVDEFEWSDTRKYDVSDMLGQFGTVRKAGSAYLWMKHDTNFVYVAVTSLYSSSDDRNDQVAVYFDEDRDGVWEEDTSEGNYWFANFPGAPDSTTYRGWIPIGGGVLRYRVPSVVTVCSLYNGYMNYEAAIPIGAVNKHDLWFRPNLNVDTMRFCMYDIDYPGENTYAWWPQTALGTAFQTPYAWGYAFFQPPLYDVGVQQILSPTGTVITGTSVTPKAIVKNYGLATIGSFPVIFTITEQKAGEYIDTVMVQLSGMQTDTVEFDPWFASTITIYQTECKVDMSGDMTAGNNVLTGSFEVISPPPGTWARRNDISGIVKDGGALVAASGTKDENVLYALRGTKTKGFYMYNGTWTAKETIPFGYKFPLTDPPKINKKYPGKGAALCYDGVNTIYASKGNGTWEFWAYDITANTWTAKAFIPSLQKIKGGTSMAYKNGLVYLLAGAQKKDNLNNFFAYDPTADTTNGLPWTTTLTGAPVTPPATGKAKPFKDGSCLSVIGNTIYALKGGDKYNFFYAYDIATDIWTEMETIPLVHPILGKKNKVSDGGAITTSGGVLYVIKGKGKQDFWSYTPGAKGTWAPLDTIPRVDKQSVPKTGAAIAFANDSIYLLKGNKTLELWRYGPLFVKAAVARTPFAETYSAVMTTTTTNELKFNFNINPNPFTKLTIIRYTVPVSGKVSIKLYNAIGRLIETLNNGYLTQGIYTTSLSTTNLSKGIYFIRYEDIANRKEIKLINQ